MKTLTPQQIEQLRVHSEAIASHQQSINQILGERKTRNKRAEYRAQAAATFQAYNSRGTNQSLKNKV